MYITPRVLVSNEHNNLGLVPGSQAMHRSHFERARSARSPWQAQAQALSALENCLKNGRSGSPFAFQFIDLKSEDIKS